MGYVDDSFCDGPGQMPDLRAWIDGDSAWSLLANTLAVHDGNRLAPGQEIPRELIPGLLHQAWSQSSPKQWAAILGSILVSLASEGNLHSVDQLLSAGANLAAKDNEGFTALHKAASFGHVEVVARILGEEAERNSREPSQASRLIFQPGHDNPRLVPAASIMRRRGTVNIRNNRGCSPLHSAAACGNARVVQLLLENGAFPNERSAAHETPLHYAVRARSGEGIGLIVRAGGDVMACDIAGRTPLHAAAISGTEASTRALVLAGGDTEARASISGRTPLHDACAYGRPDIVGALLALGADECAVDNNGRQPVDAAAECDDPRVGDAIKRILEKTPADRRWRRRSLLLMLRYRPPLSKLEMGDMEASGVDEELWRLVVSTVELGDGAFREVVMYL